jgi:phenylalanyl-tRNA synthetase alpha chain
LTRTFRPLEARVVEGLAGHEVPVRVDALARELGADQSPVSAALEALAREQLVTIDEEREEELRPGSKSAEWLEGLSPERRVARALAAAGGEASLKELPGLSGLEQRTIGQSLRWLAARGWADKQGSLLRLAEGWGGAEPPLEADERLVKRLHERGAARPADLEAEGVDVDAALASLSKRAGVVETKTRRRRLARLTDDGRRLAAEGVPVREEVNELTTEMLVSGRWREVDFRPYDVSLPGPRLRIGREHPFRKILEETRSAFLLMGFEETFSPWVESGFWDFDALFQPQDHPARDMQDTFYVARPERMDLPGEDLVERVKRTHEDGGETGSIGWRYAWSRELAERCVLRTHTTAASIRSLAQDPRSPRKVFCVGPVFRRETIDYKHLPVFYQVDGIVIDAQASFASLLTLLRTFYGKMGFERIQFRPAFFPYTEPSVEVFVWMESRGDWVEMGGAGVFRAEVTEPLGCSHPVLAWGLGLERLAMFRYGLNDIREIYLSHLDWLEEVPQCRL